MVPTRSEHRNARRTHNCGWTMTRNPIGWRIPTGGRIDHRPRWILTAGIDEPNAIVQLTGAEDEPNIAATCLELRDGLEASSVNCWPNVRCDLASINDRLHALLPAGFY